MAVATRLSGHANETSVGSEAVAESLTGRIALIPTLAVTRDVPSNPARPVDGLVNVASADIVAERPLIAVMMVPSGMPGPVIFDPGDRNTF